MEYAFFVGCNSSFRFHNYELSTQRISKELGIDLVDIKFICCGYPLEPIKQEATLLMAARNLAIAEEKGLDILTICNTCTKTLTKYNELLRNDKNLLTEVNRSLNKLGYEYKGNVTVKHLVRILCEDVGITRVRESVKNPLKNLAVSTHYGCHYNRPSEIYNNFDDPENPRNLDELVEAAGSKIVHYKNKKMCCGGPLLSTSSNITLSLSDEKLKAVKSAGADALIVICPFCGLVYDFCQNEIEETFGRKYGITILFLPQFLGLSMGIDKSELGLDLNRVSARSLLEKI
jgi:heterodisulfide reductase subunit B